MTRIPGLHLVLQNSDYKNIQGFFNPTMGTRIEMVIDMRKCKSDVSLEHLSKEAQDDRLNTRKSGLSHHNYIQQLQTYHS